ncbi:hypothetical protein [Streptomyces sp. NPDC003480]
MTGGAVPCGAPPILGPLAILGPLGLADALRVQPRHGPQTWGLFVLCRDPHSPPFSPADEDENLGEGELFFRRRLPQLAHPPPATDGPPLNDPPPATDGPPLSHPPPATDGPPLNDPPPATDGPPLSHPPPPPCA